MNKHSLSQKLGVGVIVMIVFLIALTITTFALIYSNIRTENNIFETGVIKININDGKPIIGKGDEKLKFEPGKEVKRDFFVKNDSTDQVYYKLYFDNVEGALANYLEIKIYDEGKILYQGRANEFLKDKVSAFDEFLLVGQKKNLQISFKMDETTPNSAQNQIFYFDFCVDAVQVKNNPDKVFN